MSSKDKYIVNYNKCLGQGATASVYLGISKDKGEVFAFKCSRSQQLKKEVMVLKDLEHKNIIKFYENLNNFESFTQVIVMEYCNKGSLYDFIDIHKGLCDNMFLKTLECLYESMHYLRGKNYIHRDIKPGNMMVHQDSMGHYHVKLGDMGTAKKVDDDGNFATLCGTEEYLHPDMYIRMLEGISKQHKFNVDLWSIGITLYHAVATQLPFIPFNYSRKFETSKVMLLHMYETKSVGVISGKQNSDRKDDITWSKELPPNCRMSKELKTLAAKLLGSLMDLTVNNTYDRFFDESKVILQMKRCLLFNGSNGELHMLYMDQLTYNNIVKESSKILKLKKEEFILLTNKGRIENQYDITKEIVNSIPNKGHLHYEMGDDTIMAVCVAQNSTSNATPPQSVTDSTELIIHQKADNYEAPSRRYSSFHDVKRYSDNLMKGIYEIFRSTNYLDCQMKCYKTVIRAFNQTIMMDQVNALHLALPWQMKAIRDACLMSESLVNTVTRLLSKRADIQSNQLENLVLCKNEIEQLRQKANEGEKCGEQYYSKIVEKREMENVTNRIMTNCISRSGDSLSELHSCDASLDFLVHISEELVNEVKLIPPDHVNEEKKYIQEIWKRHNQQFQHYQTAKDYLIQKQRRVRDLHSGYHNWLKQSKSVMQRVCQLKDFLDRQEDRRLSLRAKFVQIHEFLDKILNNIESQNLNLPSLSLSDDSVVKSKIMEIKELAERTKNIFYSNQEG